MTLHHCEGDHGNTHQEGGRSPPRTPHQCPGDDTKHFKLELDGAIDVGSADTAAAAADDAGSGSGVGAGASASGGGGGGGGGGGAAAAVITIDEAASPTTGASLAAGSFSEQQHLVCSQCTFNNNPNAADGAPLLPVPSACAVCFNPLKAAAELLPPPTHHPDHRLLPRGSRRPPSTDSLPPSLAGEEKSTLESLPFARQCPLCTVLVSDPRMARCPVCRALISPSDSVESDVPVQERERVQPECCSVCTLRNDPGAVVCTACGTPLFDEDGLQSHFGVPPSSANEAGRRQDAGRGSDNAGIPTAAELTARTIQDGGDSRATTPGFIPRIHERLADEHNTDGVGAGRRIGPRRGRGGREGGFPRAAGRGRGGVDWCVSGASGKRGRAEWRLCEPRTAHCTQRGSSESGFSCGYRNIQIMCSALMERPEYRRVLFGGSGCIPGVRLLQCWIERAWEDGYDPDGCEQLGGPGALMGSDIWIGATECATLLRSFGVKAEVIDFESTAKVEAPVADGKAPQEGNEQTKRRKTLSSQPSLTQSVSSKASRGPTQQSILSFLPASSNVPEGCTLAERHRGTPDNSSHGTATASDIIDLEPEERENVREKLGGGLPGSSVDGNRVGQVASAGGGGGGGNGDSVPEPRKADLASTASVSPQVAAAAGKASTGPLPTNAKRGGRRGDRKYPPNARRPGNLSKSAGQRMGQALTEWSWEYFCTLWGAEEVTGDGGGGSLTSRPRESASSAGAEAEENRTLDGEKNGKAAPTAAVLFRADAPRPGKVSADCGLTGATAGAGAGAAGAASGGSGGSGDGSHSARGEGGAREGGGGEGETGAPPDAARSRPPPPLYFQHDGHSRSVVGVLWPGGRGKSGKRHGWRGSGSENGSAGPGRGVGNDGDGGSGRGGGNCEGGRGGEGSSGERGRRLQPGSLLVFDPSHSGGEIRKALDDTQTQRWGSLLKRGEHTMRRRQFQLVVIRPGLIEGGEADAWKKIGVKKIRVD